MGYERGAPQRNDDSLGVLPMRPGLTVSESVSPPPHPHRPRRRRHDPFEGEPGRPGSLIAARCSRDDPQIHTPSDESRSRRPFERRQRGRPARTAGRSRRLRGRQHGAPPSYSPASSRATGGDVELLTQIPRRAPAKRLRVVESPRRPSTASASADTDPSVARAAPKVSAVLADAERVRHDDGVPARNASSTVIGKTSPTEGRTKTRAERKSASVASGETAPMISTDE